jgi:hypothetical protein
VDKKAGAITSAEVVGETRAGARVAFPFPLMRALIDFFQALVGANLGILVDATREDPAKSALDSIFSTS